MWELEKAEHRRIDAFELWCWRRLLESLGLQGDPTSPSWVFIGMTDAETEIPTLWPHDAKSWLIWKDPGAEKDWGQEEKREWDGWMVSPTRWTWVWVDTMDMSLSRLQELVMDREACCAAIQTWLNNWTELAHSSILPWRSPWVEELGGLQSWGLRVRHNWMTNTFTCHTYIRSPHHGSRESEAGEFSISSFLNCFCLISLSLVRHTSHLVGENFYILWSWKWKRIRYWWIMALSFTGTTKEKCQFSPRKKWNVSVRI